MFSVKGVAMTDGKNRKNHIIQLEAIINAYYDSWNTPMIMNVGHDRSKPIGYTILEGIYMEPGKAYVVNSSNFPESEDEQGELNRLMGSLDTKIFITERKEEVEKLYSLLGGYATEKAKVAPVGQAVAIIDEGIIGRIFPDVLELLDDGLINLKELSPVYKKSDSLEGDRGILVPGVYQKGQFLLFAHPFFRRNLCVANTINDVFFEAFEKLRGNESAELKVAIDMNMIGLAGTESLELEYQYWWGPKFNEDLYSIPTGVTCYKNEHYDNFFTNITDTQFYWHTQDEIITFECEEICDRENALIEGNSYYGCRYVHSMVSNSTQLPYHLDGAIRLYTDEEIIERIDESTDISKYGKKSLYFKLWRIDSDINVSTWKELITHYFRDNQLIGEYFGGVDEKFSQIRIEEQTKQQRPIKNSYIPVEFKEGDGLRMYFRYCNKKDIPVDRDAIVDNLLMITKANGETEKMLEADTITLLKLLMSKGIRIRKPITSLVDFNDMIFNYPCIRCTCTKVAEKILEAILELCLIWKKREDNRLLSFEIEINRSEKHPIRLSLAGHINDFVKILSSLSITDEMEIEEWILQIYERNNVFVEAKDNPDKFLLLHGNRLQFERNFVPPKQITRVESNDGILEARLDVPEKDKKYLLENKVITAPVYKIKNSKCTKCGQEYRECSCIKFIETDVSEEIADAEYLGMIWTNRSAYFPDGTLQEV